jgi:hypothetical protein
MALSRYYKAQIGSEQDKKDGMMKTYELRAPLSEEDVIQLKIGDLVYVSGPAFSCRSRLHRYVFDENHGLPFPPGERNVLLHAGPIMKKTTPAGTSSLICRHRAFVLKNGVPHRWINGD